MRTINGAKVLVWGVHLGMREFHSCMYLLTPYPHTCSTSILLLMRYTINTLSDWHSRFIVNTLHIIY